MIVRLVSGFVFVLAVLPTRARRESLQGQWCEREVWVSLLGFGLLVSAKLR